MIGEGIKTKPMGDVGGELRVLGLKSALYLSVICTLGRAHSHTCKISEIIMTIREGKIGQEIQTTSRGVQFTRLYLHRNSLTG